MKNIFALKGNILYTKKFGKYETIKYGYILLEDGLVKEIYEKLPQEYNNVAITDYGDSIIIPGFVDLHLHAPQLPNIGLGMDKELLPWLNLYTFPEESKYSDLVYAKKVYTKLILELWKNGTTRASIFGTVHKDSTVMLLDLFNKSGLSAYIGKVNMDRNCPENMCENTEESLRETEEIIKEYKDKYLRVKPIISPRFVPTCTLKLMKNLGELSIKYDVPIQSHLSENIDEVSLVRSLHPSYKNYSSIYKDNNLLGPKATIMAHCVLLTNEEVEILAKNNVYVAHCPNSNLNLASGIAPIRKLIENGVNVGLATDIAGGHSISMRDVISSAAQVSNIRWIESGKVDKPLSISELFYLATKGGGSFFGRVGSFEKGYEFDALIIDDSDFLKFKELSIEERIERFIYTGSYNNIKERYVSGERINQPVFE